KDVVSYESMTFRIARNPDTIEIGAAFAQFAYQFETTRENAWDVGSITGDHEHMPNAGSVHLPENSLQVITINDPSGCQVCNRPDTHLLQPGSECNGSVHALGRRTR